MLLESSQKHAYEASGDRSRRHQGESCTAPPLCLVQTTTTARMAKPATSSSSSKGKQKAVEPVSSPEKTSEQTSKATTEIKPAKKPEKVKVRRIHVAGLPDITEQEARDRFKSFGEVTGVDGLGKLDATGEQRLQCKLET